MSEMNTTARWTSDHLTKPGGTAVYAAQMRGRLRQMADEVQALLREYRDDLESEKFDGDKPFEAKFRAYRASRPLADLEKDLRSAVTHAGKLDAERQRLYVELPEKRERKSKEKKLAKERKRGLVNSRGMNAAGQIHGMAMGLEDPTDEKGLAKSGSVYAPSTGGGEDQTFMDFLQQRRA